MLFKYNRDYSNPQVLMMNINHLAQSTGLSTTAVNAIIQLLNEGATIPFIARYRKEMTQGATDEQLRVFEQQYDYQCKLRERREDILRLMTEKAQLTDALQKALNEATTLTALEDIYRPFKDKKNTRAGLAIIAGLTPIADAIEQGKILLSQLHSIAQKVITQEYATIEAVIAGAQDILAERFSDQPKQ